MSSSRHFNELSGKGTTEYHTHDYWIEVLVAMISFLVIPIDTHKWTKWESRLSWWVDWTSRRQWCTGFCSPVRTTKGGWQRMDKRCRLLNHHLTLSRLVLTTGPGIPPAAWASRLWSGFGPEIRFGSRIVQKPDPLLHGGLNPALCSSSRVFRQVWLDRSDPISGSAFRVYLFMVAFRYPTVNCKILTMVLHCHFLMYWQPLYSKQVERCSLPHPGNERQWSINNWWSCILGNLSGA